MSTRHRITEEDGQGPVVREPHVEARFLVAPGGYGQQWVVCPCCEAVPDGWDPEGRPLYTGGIITVELPVGRGMTEAVARCKCVAGDQYERQMAAFDELPPVTHFKTRPAPVLFAKGKSKGTPPPPNPVRDVEGYTAAQAAQMRRFMSGEITREEWLSNCKHLDAKHLPDEEIGPTFSDLLSPHAGGIRGLYFDHFTDRVIDRVPSPARGGNSASSDGHPALPRGDQ